jgi:hypothetical protein
MQFPTNPSNKRKENKQINKEIENSFASFASLVPHCPIKGPVPQKVRQRKASQCVNDTK